MNRDVTVQAELVFPALTNMLQNPPWEGGKFPL